MVAVRGDRRRRRRARPLPRRARRGCRWRACAPGARPAFRPPRRRPRTSSAPAEEQSISALSGSAMIGGPDTVRAKLDALRERTAADELMITTMVHDHADRIRSYELIAEPYDLAARRRGRRRDDGGQMTTKAEFNAEEWEQDRRGPGDRRADRDHLASAAARSARAWRWRRSIARRRRSTRGGDLVGELVAVRAQPRPEAVLEQGGPAHPGPRQDPRGGRAGRGEGDPRGARRLPRRSRSAVAQHAAEADKSGGFLGIGGERVTGNEEAALNEIAAALGTERPPAASRRE